MNQSFLKECLLDEVIGKGRKFTWGRVFRHYYRQPKKRFLFWWRIASCLHQKGNKRSKKIAAMINRRLIRNYNTEISLDAKIKPGLRIAHYNGIVISGYCQIGRNFLIRQNTTIGIQNIDSSEKSWKITIGDNVTIGANSCIISDQINIGDNVTIGAMSFVNKDILSNCVFYTEKTSRVLPANIENKNVPDSES
ncbi:serine acetyltransferase [Enterobacteriaceae bacterium BIT-l23]|uniref:serine acetyltransferase n=1 Tax=Jejubacter sp. L23 TaxID=3092086 RepID=UPI001585960D|nr:serine acetyltransferase [Enterobacteriaceae bacterium BIT-l23]